MYYYLDGYNLLFSLMDSQLKLSGQRRTLILFLQNQFSSHHMKGTLVFDGAHRREEESGLSYEYPLEIAYAPRGQSADSYIVEKIETESRRKQLIVVTNDQGLKRRAHSAGAKTQGTAAFIQLLKKKSLKKRKGKRAPVIETQQNIDRLLKIFEERLRNGPEEEN